MDLTTKAKAIIEHLNIDINNVREYEDQLDGFDDTDIDIKDEELLVLTDSERDDYIYDAIDDRLDDLDLGDIEEYFDKDGWRDDQDQDGGDLLAHYDQEENEYDHDGETIYIYRRG